MKNTLNYDVADGTTTLDWSVAASGVVMIAAKYTGIDAAVTITPLLGPSPDELIEYTDGALTLATGETFNNIIIDSLPNETYIKLKIDVGSATEGTINTLEIRG